MNKTCYIYIMTNKLNSVLYTGMTGRGEQRAHEHSEKVNPNSFTARYNIHKVVYAEAFLSPIEAAEAERRIKGWTRKKKVALIESVNPTWTDLTERDASPRSAIQPYFG